MLSKTWFFRFLTFAFIILITPAPAIFLHAPGGFLIILALSILVGLFENSFKPVLYRIYTGIAKNILLVLFSLWYAIGLIINLFVRGHGLDDWRFMMGPIILFIGILFAFAFMSDANCGRYLQIWIIIGWGIQSIFTIPQLYNNPGIAREMWAELSGKWIYGDQSYFATSIILLPMLYWRSFKESGILKPILFACCTMILISALISSFMIAHILFRESLFIFLK